MTTPRVAPEYDLMRCFLIMQWGKPRMWADTRDAWSYVVGQTEQAVRAYLAAYRQ